MDFLNPLYRQTPHIPDMHDLFALFAFNDHPVRSFPVQLFDQGNIGIDENDFISSAAE